MGAPPGKGREAPLFRETRSQTAFLVPRKRPAPLLESFSGRPQGRRGSETLTKEVG
jgi:hypothetical protein